MAKTYVTFGQLHTHRVNNKTLDCECVAVINCESSEEGRELAFEYFDGKFCFEYPEEHFDMDSLRYYPRGLIEVN